jgi:hypothetical protein
MKQGGGGFTSKSLSMCIHALEAAIVLIKSELGEIRVIRPLDNKSQAKSEAWID